MLNKSTIRILVLDDDLFMLNLIVRILDKLGFTSVSTCYNGQNALTMLDSPKNSPNLILLDINMPVMDGAEFVRHLVERHYTGNVILISGEDERIQQAAEKLARAHKINVLGHLHKPISPEQLAELIGKWTAPPQDKSRAAKKVYGADEVRAAIANGELVNYYQPKVDTATERVAGVETLVRWRHPLDGMVFPDQFIGVAEANGLIDDLTRAVLTDALTQCKKWIDAGLLLQVAVNLSMKNLASLDFLDWIVALATKSGVPTQMVMLEVTESHLMEDLRTPLEIFTRLRLKRFHLSIDDFGTGNSSLAQLRDLPFDELKIDMGFVHGAWNNDKLRAMFYSSLSLARKLKMSAVAEGVEDREDWDFVRESKCDVAQGYFIAKPMPAADLPAWIESWQKRFPVSNRGLVRISS